MTTNRTHRARLARAPAAVADIGYQAALARVVSAAEAGLLPGRLDAAGMRQALDVLLAKAPTGPAPRGTRPGTVGLQPRYYRLSEVVAGRLQPGVAQRLDRARALGVPAVRCRGSYDPVEMLGAVMADGDDPDADADWWLRVAGAGARPDYALGSPYPAKGDADGYGPIDRALHTRDATGDIDAYERTLRAIIRAERRDVDAFAHLGHLYLAMADPAADEVVITPPPPTSQRQAWLRTALGHYQAGVGIAELGLPDPFTGFLVWSELDNRPFFRALHGMALALWRLRRFDSAEVVLLNMLWLNPMDNQGARALLPDVRAGRRWDDTDGR